MAGAIRNVAAESSVAMIDPHTAGQGSPVTGCVEGARQCYFGRNHDSASSLCQEPNVDEALGPACRALSLGETITQG